jgi:hypothetical protein
VSVYAIKLIRTAICPGQGHTGLNDKDQAVYQRALVAACPVFAPPAPRLLEYRPCLLFHKFAILSSSSTRAPVHSADLATIPANLICLALSYFTNGPSRQAATANLTLNA